MTPKKPASKKPLTAADRHKRFVDMAKEVGASDKPEDFERALKKITGKNAGNS